MTKIEYKELTDEIAKSLEELELAKRNFKITCEKICIMKEEGDKIKKHTTHLLNEQEKLSKDSQALLILQKKSQHYQSEIKRIEIEIKTILNLPEPLPNEDLVKANIKLETELIEKLNKINRIKELRNKINNLEKEKNNLLQQIIDKQVRNEDALQKQTAKQQYFQEKKDNLKSTFTNLQKLFDTEQNNRDQAMRVLSNIRKTYEDAKIKMEEMQRNVAEKQAKLENTKDKIDVKKKYIDELNLKKQRVLEKLQNLNRDIEICLKENEEFKLNLLKMSETYNQSNETKLRIEIEIEKTKNQLQMEQQEITNRKFKIENLQEELNCNIEQNKTLNMKNEIITSEWEELKKQLEDMDLKAISNREELTSIHKERIVALIKEHSLINAKIEFAQVRLNDKAAKTEQYKKEICEYQKIVKSEKVKMKSPTQSSNKENPIPIKGPKRIKMSSSFEKQKSATSVLSNFSDFDKLKQENTELIEKEIDENLLTPYGKSPGILKSPFNKAQIQVNKRVTFTGIPSTDSSSFSSQSQEIKFDETVDEWLGTADSIKKFRSN
ncbi:hypothetical protein ABEB36_010160 [Hypothenemus hampei]